MGIHLLLCSHPSNHPSIDFCTRSRLQGQQSNKGCVGIPLPSHLLQLLLGGIQRRSQASHEISPACPWSSLRCLTSQTCPNHPLQEAVQEASWVNAQATSSCSSGLSPFQMTKLLIFSRRLSQNTLRRKLISAACVRSYSFGHYPKLVTIGKGRNVD